MVYKTVYECDCCGSKFDEPTYDNGISMGLISYRRKDKTSGVEGNNLTLGMNGHELCLCESCLKKLERALKEMGFLFLYNGCTSYKL